MRLYDVTLDWPNGDRWELCHRADSVDAVRVHYAALYPMARIHWIVQS